MFWRLFFVVALCLAAEAPSAFSQPAPSVCHVATMPGMLMLQLPGQPFSTATTRDSCSIFVAVGAQDGNGGEVTVLSARSGPPVRQASVTLPVRPAGMALSPDERFLAIAAGSQTYVLTVDGLKAGRGELVGSFPNGSGAAAIKVLFGDDTTVFVTEERAKSIAVLKLDPTKTDGSGLTFTGRIATGAAPVGMARSPDGRWLYAVSERAYGTGQGPCRNELSQSVVGREPEGELLLIDIEKAKARPQGAIAGRALAGCSPVRVATSRQGDEVWVSARADNQVRVYASAVAGERPTLKLEKRLRAGTAPVGIARDPANDTFWVANSDRFASNARGGLQGFDARGASLAAEAVSKLPVSPRELEWTSDGAALLVTPFQSHTLLVLPRALLEK